MAKHKRSEKELLNEVYDIMDSVIQLLKNGGAENERRCLAKLEALRMEIEAADLHFAHVVAPSKEWDVTKAPVKG